MTEKPVTPQEYYKDFPEAPFSDTFKWTDADGFEHLSTARAWSHTSLMGAVDSLRAALIESGGKPPVANRAPSNVMQAREDGLPVVDSEGKPVMTNLPDGVHMYTVAQLFHGKTQTGKDFLGVKTVEKPHNRKWGVKCFHPTGVDGWKAWPVGEAEPIYYPPQETAKRVLIREAEGEGKYPDVLEFQTESPF